MTRRVSGFGVPHHVLAELRKMRLEVNFSQAYVGGLIGVGVDVLSRWECGRVDPSLSKVEELANAFDLTLGLNELVVPVSVARPDRPLAAGGRVEMPGQLDLLQAQTPRQRLDSLLARLEPPVAAGR